MALTVGEPVWTEGHFRRVSAQDDLGFESVGNGLLRRLIPGVVQTTPSAGYYAYYPFLVDEFARRYPEVTERQAFKPFYRRQEAAFALACSFHEHRGPLRGLNGVEVASVRGQRALERNEVQIDLLPLAEEQRPTSYMQSPYGGYGLFYRGVLEDIGLVRLGATRFVDLTTERGKSVAAEFRSVIEGTDYWRHYADDQSVPVEALRELGSAACPCRLPGRADHTALLDTFFAPRSEAEWEQSRRYRVRSLGLFLDFHKQRPSGPADLSEWRRALAGRRFSEKHLWDTAFEETHDAWRAYQLRETEVLALEAIWVCFLQALGEHESAQREPLVQQLLGEVDWRQLGGPATRLDAAMTAAAAELATPLHLMATVEACESVVQRSTAMASALRVLLALGVHASGDDAFGSLLEEGDSARWSVRHLLDWLAARRSAPVGDVLRELLDEMYFQHLRVATTKVTTTDHRDPYCIDDEDGMLRLIRMDEPLWTGGRFTTVNHLLWTLDLLNEPEGDIRPTALGLQQLESLRSDG